MNEEIVEEAITSFKAEQRERQVEKVKKGLREAVGHLAEIEDQEKSLTKIFKDMGYTLSPEFRKFLSKVENYDDLVFSVTSNGYVGIGTTEPDSNIFVMNSDAQTITSV